MALVTGDGDRHISDMFVKMFAVYTASPDNIKKTIENMCRVIEESDDPDEKELALDTLTEILFPTGNWGDDLDSGIDDLNDSDNLPFVGGPGIM